MNPEKTVQHISDEFHAITTEADALLVRLTNLTGSAAQLRIDTAMPGIETQRTIGHLTTAAQHLANARSSVTLGHQSAAKDAERADFPWECPPDVTEAKAQTHLRAVGE